MERMNKEILKVSQPDQSTTVVVDGDTFNPTLR